MKRKMIVMTMYAALFGFAFTVCGCEEADEYIQDWLDGIDNPGCQLEDSDVGFCGDGIVQTELGEVCDDGNNLDGDDCSADCSVFIIV